MKRGGSEGGLGEAGNICTGILAGIFQTIWGDRERFGAPVLPRYCKEPQQDWPIGRTSRPTDPCWPPTPISASSARRRRHQRGGARLGTKDLESACLTVPRSRKPPWCRSWTRSRDAFPRSTSREARYVASKEITDKVIAVIETMIGKIARPKKIQHRSRHAEDRSGKICGASLPRSPTRSTRRHHHARQSRYRGTDPVSVQGKEKLRRRGPEDLKQFGKESNRVVSCECERPTGAHNLRLAAVDSLDCPTPASQHLLDFSDVRLLLENHLPAYSPERPTGPRSVRGGSCSAERGLFVLEDSRSDVAEVVPGSQAGARSEARVLAQCVIFSRPPGIRQRLGRLPAHPGDVGMRL